MAKIEFWYRLIKPAAWSSQALQLPKIQVHRGYHQEGIQENTLQAFAKAKELGAEMIECDVQLSLDEVPVIFHDYNLHRLGQRPDPVARCTSSELREWVNAPSLEQILLDPSMPQFVNIEMKSQYANDSLPRKIAEVVKRTKAEARIIFSSFNPVMLWVMQNYLPEVPRALLVTEENDPANKWWLKKMLAAPLLKLQMLNLDEKLLTPEVIQFWQKQKMPIAAWTVNDKARAKALLDAGVTSIITDQIELKILVDKFN